MSNNKYQEYRNLKNIFEQWRELFVIHYIIDNEKVIAVEINSMKSKLYKSYIIDSKYDEKTMLTDVFTFIAKRKRTAIIYFNSKEKSYGLDFLKRRYETITNESLDLSSSHQYDITDYLSSMLGDDYINNNKVKGILGKISEFWVYNDDEAKISKELHKRSNVFKKLALKCYQRDIFEFNLYYKLLYKVVGI